MRPIARDLEETLTLKRKETLAFTLIATIAIVFASIFFYSLGVQSTSTLNNVANPIVIKSVGEIENIGVSVWFDNDLTLPCNFINWGLVTPNSSYTLDIYLKNEGNKSVTLSLNTTNWKPINASQWITLDWSYLNETLAPNGVLSVTLMLTIDEAISGINAFEFDITVTAKDTNGIASTKEIEDPASIG